MFDATHALLLDLYAAGVVDGFRIDHPDGLADPEGYLRAAARRDRRRLGRRREDPRGRRAAFLAGRAPARPATTRSDGVQAALSTPHAGAGSTRCGAACVATRPRRRSSGGQASGRRDAAAPGAAAAHAAVAAVPGRRGPTAARRRGLRARPWSTLLGAGARSTGPTCDPGTPVPTRVIAERVDRRPARAPPLAEPELAESDRLGDPARPGRRSPASTPECGPGRAVPAGLRTGDGEGRGGHGVLPLAPAGRAQRGRRRPRSAGARRTRAPARLGAAAAAGLHPPA